MRIYVACHKPCALPEFPDGYVLIQVGAVGKDAFLPVRDDGGDNISERNGTYNELTALYWIWKNDPSNEDDVVGLCHYRRYFVTCVGKACNLVFRKKTGLLTERQVDRKLKGRDVLVHNSTLMLPDNGGQFAKTLNARDLPLMRRVVEELDPEGLWAFDAMTRSKRAHLLNMMAAKKRDVDAYCTWLFPLLFEFESRLRMDFGGKNMARRVGMVAERMLDVWLLRNAIKYREVFSINTERTDWRFW